MSAERGDKNHEDNPEQPRVVHHNCQTCALCLREEAHHGDRKNQSPHELLFEEMNRFRVRWLVPERS